MNKKEVTELLHCLIEINATQKIRGKNSYELKRHIANLENYLSYEEKEYSKYSNNSQIKLTITKIIQWLVEFFTLP